MEARRRLVRGCTGGIDYVTCGYQTKPDVSPPPPLPLNVPHCSCVRNGAHGEQLYICGTAPPHSLHHNTAQPTVVDEQLRDVCSRQIGTDSSIPAPSAAVPPLTDARHAARHGLQAPASRRQDSIDRWVGGEQSPQRTLGSYWRPINSSHPYALSGSNKEGPLHELFSLLIVLLIDKPMNTTFILPQETENGNDPWRYSLHSR